MFGQRPAGSTASQPLGDPNDLIRRIDQTTTQTYHWVRAGVVVIIILLLVIVLIG